MVAKVFDCRTFTKTTPVMVRPNPIPIIKVNGSLNKIQAITAVVGGVKYSKLVTLVAAPLRIIIKSKLIEPIESGKIAQSNAVITGIFQIMTPDSKKYMQAKHTTADTPNWMEDPALRSNTGQNFF